MNAAGRSLWCYRGHRARRMVARLLVAVLVCGAAPVRGEEAFKQSFRGEQSGEPMMVLSSGDAAKYAKRTAEGYLFSLPAAEAPLPAAGLMTQFRVRGDFTITAAYEIIELEPPATGYGSGASLFVVTTSADGATVARCDQPNAGSVVSTDRIAAMGTGSDKHDAKTVAATGKAGKLQLIREGTTLRYFASEGDAQPQEIRRERFVDDDLTTVLLLADTGLSNGALAVRFNDFSVRAEDLPLGPLSENQARKWLLAWLAGSGVVVATIIFGAVLIRRRKWAAAQGSPGAP